MTMTVHLARLLVLAVIFVNGWTDAPNAIATAVGSGALSFRRGVALAAVCNFIGAVMACLCFPAVADTMGELVAFSSPQTALAALNAALLSIVLWAVAAWRFGLPTSESHALLAGLSGGAVALGAGAASLSAGAWIRALAGLALSLPAGVLAGRVFRQALMGRVRRPAVWQKGGAALTALLHGVQDGQKFLALLLLTGGLGGNTDASRLTLALLTAGVMALGTALGGRPIVEKVGSELASLSPADGLAADLGAGLVLLVCSALGLPASTTHAKVAAICGAGRGTNRRVMGQMVGTWALTFPACGAMAFLLTRVMMG
ncbi:MAG: inorganic phosphate transporter [Oscillospiraceae bacterium]|nr:inorganic phosphate transporter [Oscillospiraceae bacterium]MDE7170263.1 inorganic phosphate transporter [Oscillospiraceae bacterium]